MTRQAFDADTAAARVVEAMRPLASATRAVQEKRYLKSDLDFLGVGVPGAWAVDEDFWVRRSALLTLLPGIRQGATYLIQCPAGAWNGTLYLYSHGYVTPGAANPAQDVGDPATGAWMLANGYALAGSSYSTTGWAIAQALPDQISTLNAFGSMYGQPKTTVAWGHSLGGIITAGRQPERDRLAGQEHLLQRRHPGPGAHHAHHR